MVIDKEQLIAWLNAFTLRIFNFLQVSEAMQKMHDRKNVGKLVLDPSLEPKPKPATPLKTKGKSIDKEDKDKKKEDENTTNGTASPPGK